MAFFFKEEIQETDTPAVQFNQPESCSSPPTQPHPSTLHALLPSQWRLAVMPKKPKTVANSSKFITLPPPPPPPTLQPPIHRTYASVPWSLCRNQISGNQFSYRSRDSLLPKLFQALIQCQFCDPRKARNSEKLLRKGIEHLGPPVDIWLVLPLVHPQQPPPPWKIMPYHPDQQVAHGWAIGPVKTTLETLNWPIGTGNQVALTEAFPWAIDDTGTKLPNYKDIPKDVLKKIMGFARCDMCGLIMGVAYDLSIRLNVLINYLKAKKEELRGNAEGVLKNTDLSCFCDGSVNPGKPIIHADMRKINWLFLFVSCGLGYCTVEQLKYFCNIRELPTEGTKNVLLFHVWSNLYQQLGLPIFL